MLSNEKLREENMTTPYRRVWGIFKQLMLVFVRSNLAKSIPMSWTSTQTSTERQSLQSMQTSTTQTTRELEHKKKGRLFHLPYYLVTELHLPVNTLKLFPYILHLIAASLIYGVSRTDRKPTASQAI
jgi:hypothetical protein